MLALEHHGLLLGAKWMWALVEAYLVTAASCSRENVVKIAIIIIVIQ